MSKYTLTLLDTTGIQDYIFNSNRLQENIGASEIVYRATTLWVFKALEETVGTAHNILNRESLDWTFDEGKNIESNENLKAEVIQAAGGNVIILFRDATASREFVNKITWRVLQDAPGLNLLAQHNDQFEFGTSPANLPSALNTLREVKMKEHKLSRRGSTPLRGMSVTAMCDSTGLPAIATLGDEWAKDETFGLPGEDMTSLISSETAAKRRWRKAANDRLKSALKDHADKFVFPFDLEKIGRFKGDESYIAVIHADGNRMGERIKELGERAENDRQYIQDLRAFSKKINAISLNALQTVVSLVVQAVKNEDIPFEFVKDKEGKNTKQKYLPFRPLVFGGDDVTFVCNGLIGVSLAVAYIEAFEEAAKKNDEKDFHASAGISIVKMHYPFTRAYKLAEELTASAKKFVKETQPKTDFSAIDWHFAQSGLSGSLSAIREKEYSFKDKSLKLFMRPLALDDGARSWKTVKDIMSTFKKDWAEQHNKVVALREVLRKGNANLVHDYLQDYDLLKKKLPKIEGMGEEIRTAGWQGETCYYFDAIELLDHYVSLEAKS